MATLYRKYRPQNFKEVVNQNHIKITLENEIKTGKTAHAYLFCGPRGVGKTTMARVIVKTINCLKRKAADSDPCNECEICKDITAGRSLDIIEMDAASHTGVENVRENIIASARVAPSRCKYKVFIIDEAHMLSISAFNALLKIIEEPPAYVMFILCTTEVHKVPTTIISRCQRFDFKRIGVNDIVKKLNYIIKNEGIKIDRSILESIARQSGGHMRDAESLLGQIVAIGGKEITQEEAELVIPRNDLNEVINFIDLLIKKDSASCIKLINKLMDEGMDLKMFLNDLIEILRKIMLTKINPALTQKFGLELGEGLEIKVGEISSGLNLEHLLVVIERFMKARNEIKGSFITQLPVELAAAELCMGVSAPRANPGNNEIRNSKLPARQALAGGEIRNNVPVVDQPIQASSPAGPTAISAANSGKVDQDAVLAKWSEVLIRIKQHNHSLSFILRVCKPIGISNNELTIAFKYKFHKNRVDERAIKDIIEKVLREVYGAPITISAIIDENLEIADNNMPPGNGAVQNDRQAKPAEDGKQENKGQDNLVDSLLKTFGGKVVDSK